MKFIDSTLIQVRAGRGGNGIVSFRSGKSRVKMGVDGGDGGRGGDVVLLGNPQLNTLSSMRYRSLYVAEDGSRGGTNCCRGRCGKPLVIPVPLGTEVFDAATGEMLGEVLTADEKFVVAQGGRHGLGNMHWLSSTHQAPEEFRPGADGEERELRLELKLLADVGLAGFPNAGKSTLLSKLSAARPKIADYPFTTLVPNLGVIEFAAGDYGRDVVVADVPGLVEGASDGRGLGHAFLKHLERTRLVVYVLDPLDPERDPYVALTTLREEMGRFSADLAAKPALIILNKTDLMDAEELQSLSDALRDDEGALDVLTVSALTGEGISALKYRLRELVAAQDAAAQDAAAPAADGASVFAH